MKYPILATALLAAAPLSHAGETYTPAPEITPAAESSGWEFSGSIYAPLMGLEGDIGVAALTTSVDLSFGDILEELDGRGSTGSVYWEGISELVDATGRRVGLGYLEMTGYAAALKL